MPSETNQAMVRYMEVTAHLKSRAGTLALALPPSVRIGREVDLRRAQRVITHAQHLVWENQKLLQCTDKTLHGAIIRVCQLGLELDPSLGQAYLVPYKENCQLIVGYKGFIALMMRSGMVSGVSAEVVRFKDLFVFEYGSKEFLRHKPSFEESEPIAVYAIAHMKDGHKRFRVMSIDAVNKIRDVSLAKTSRKDSPWRVYYEEMARKTAIRNLAKYIPQAAEAHVEAVRDEHRDAGIMTPPPDYDEIEASVVDEPQQRADGSYEDEPPMREPGHEG